MVAEGRQTGIKMPLTFADRIRMWFIKVPFKAVRRCVLASEAAGAPLEPRQLENHYLATGDIDSCTMAWIRAHELDVPIKWDLICAVDLAGEDPVKMVELVAERTLIRPAGICSLN